MSLSRGNRDFKSVIDLFFKGRGEAIIAYLSNPTPNEAFSGPTASLRSRALKSWPAAKITLGSPAFEPSGPSRIGTATSIRAIPPPEARGKQNRKPNPTSP